MGKITVLRNISILILCNLITFSAPAQNADSLTCRKIFDEVMLHSDAYDNLHYLCKNIGHRLAGSPQADMAVRWAYQLMQQYDFDSVWLQEVMVPHWERGPKEYGEILGLDQINILALGGSVATPLDGITENVIEVSDFDELKALGAEKIKGKIVFYNHIFPQNVINSFEGYGEAGPYRWTGANVASKLGAKAVIIRSVGSAYDDFPHTGSTHFDDDVKKIPCAALSPIDADRLHDALEKDPSQKFKMIMGCKMMDSVKSYNVIAEIRGSELPNEIIVVGGHFDSWDVGEGAHDDGTGVVQSLEVIRCLHALGIQPKRTIRCVFFMNEENGNMGGKTYGKYVMNNKTEKHIAAIESDAGGFSPRGFSMPEAFMQHPQFDSLKALLYPYGSYLMIEGHGGTDIGPMEDAGTMLIGLIPDSQRYMDIHHTDNDVFEHVNRRELHLGAATMAMLAWWISEYGVQ
ncbi:MAG: M20/M25/M40 family metallo-hydrolase [Chitinophagales bacterium]